jgi:CarboxypepD_reg-like domain/TonB dependent receptor-like, beta-barrel/TonB-dependent Receptor Plug Domain
MKFLNCSILVFLLAFLLHVTPAVGQNKFTISGYVKSKASGETLIGAGVYIKEILKGTATNQYGFYSITLPEGEYTLVVSFLGYEEYSSHINLHSAIKNNIELKEKSFTTEEVVITGEKKDDNVSSVQMSKQEMDMDFVKSLPAFLGEVDVLKAIQLLPGVQSAGEGNSGYYVRGGGPDQNLVLLDEAVIYNASHLFGFFSVFNADAINNVELYKGGMPAQYGGRLASVLDISMKDGNKKEFHGQGGLGYIASRLTLEGPIKKDTASFIISARRTFIDLFLQKPFIDESSRIYGNSYYFYDVNAKINYMITDKDRVYLSGYLGRDVFSFNSKETGFKVRVPWGNATASARWNHIFADKLFMNTTLVFSDYNFNFEAEQQQFDFKLYSGIRDWNGKVDLTWFPNILHNLKFGANYIYHRFTPSNVSARSGETEFDLGDIVKLYAHDVALYVNDEWTVSDKVTLSGGIRLTYFSQVGPFTRYVQNEAGITVDTINYSNGEKVKAYQNAEPRLSGVFRLNPTSSVKGSYTQNYQYVHLATLSSVSLPTDVWVPSSSRVKPQFATQYALGYFKNFKNNLYETSVEVYYKDMKNLVEYKEGAQPEDDIKNNQDNNFVFGNGWSYGAEFFVKKKFGKVNGWIGYTLAYTDRKFPDLNDGAVYPAKYDRRHDVSFVFTYRPTKKWTFGLVWVYASGNNLTLPVSRMFLNGPVDLGVLASGEAGVGQIYADYGARNSYRQQSYHRLDISATLHVQKNRKWESSWNFSIFNVYSRLNPYFIYFDSSVDEVTGEFVVQAKQVSLFPIIPSVTYNFKF